MTNEEAKFILRACRPGGQDARDPQCAEALAQLERDPELARWFERERQFDQALARKLKQAPVPPYLPAMIFAGAKMARTESSGRVRRLLALAAGVALLLGGALFGFRAMRTPPPDLRRAGSASAGVFQDFQRDMVELIRSGSYALQLHASDHSAIRQWLASQRGQSGFVVPPGIANAPAFGCQVLEWRAASVTLVCFRHQGSFVHLFVIDAGLLKDAPAETTPQLVQVGENLAAHWTNQGKTYVLTGLNDAQALRRLL